MTTRGRLNTVECTAVRIKYFSISDVTSKSAMTPSFRGRTADMEPGVRPIISLASLPTAMTMFSLTSIATTEGSRMTMPLPFIYTRVFAVPRSIPISRLNNLHLSLFFLARRAPSGFFIRPLPPWRRQPSILILDCRYYIIYADGKFLNRKPALF